MLLEKIKFTSKFADLSKDELKPIWKSYKSVRKGLIQDVKQIDDDRFFCNSYMKNRSYMDKYEERSLDPFMQSRKSFFAPYFSSSYNDISGINNIDMVKLDKKISASTGYSVISDNLNEMYDRECGVRVYNKVYGFKSRKVIYNVCESLVLAEIPDRKYLPVIEYLITQYVEITRRCYEFHNLIGVKKYLAAINFMS